jgi:hypothetical protein
MKKLHFAIVPIVLLLLVLPACEKESECGDKVSPGLQLFAADFFLKPSEIYWGETSGIRSFTYNFTVEDICPKENPDIQVGLFLRKTNAGSARPVSVEAGVLTCLGVQATDLTMVPNDGQYKYESSFTTIGMNQCFGGQTSATIYPYITLSFNTLGSSQADSLYMIETVSDVWMAANYSKPK